MDESFNPVARANRHGGFIDDYCERFAQMFSQGFGGLLKISQIRFSIREGWRAYRDDDYIRVRDIRLGVVGCKTHTLVHTGKNIIKMRLMNRHNTLFE